MIKETDLIKFIADILEVDLKDLEIMSGRDEVEAWDSLHHLRIVMELESEYGAKIPIEEVSQINCIHDFIKYIPAEK